MPVPDATQQALAAWRLNNQVNLKLIAGIPARGFAAVPPGSRGRDVAHQLAHMHRVYVGWLRFNGEDAKKKLPLYRKKDKPSRAQLRAALRTSGKAVEALLRDRLTKGGRIRFFRGEPIRWMCYLIAHDAHHRGSILLTLKQNGMRLPDKVAIKDVWLTWYFGKA